MFWILLFVATGGLSILAINPIPIIACAVLWAIAQPVEQPLKATIREAGRNPDMPPPPTSGTGCLAFLLWCVAMGGVVLLCIGVVGVILTGGA